MAQWLVKAPSKPGFNSRQYPYQPLHPANIAPLC